MNAAETVSGLLPRLSQELQQIQLDKTRSDRVHATYEYLFQSKLLDFYRGAALEL